MIPALSLALILGGAVPTQEQWNNSLLRDKSEHLATTWTLAGTSPKSYFIYSVGDAGFRLRSNDAPSVNDVETAYRGLSADNFLGKRLRISMEMHTEGVKGGAGMWLRVDDKTGKPIVMKDMEHNLIVGTKPWAKYQLEADVPKEAAHIGYGVVLVGKGEVAFQNVNVEALDNL